MKILLISISGRGRSPGFDSLAEEYLTRLGHYGEVQAKTFASEPSFLESLGKLGGRTVPVTVLLDSRGERFSSEEFAAWIGRKRDAGVQNLIFAVGPADGWSKPSLAGASLVLSLGPMTLPHELARVVLAEQIYRAFTILANHPYHGGH